MNVEPQITCDCGTQRSRIWSGSAVDLFIVSPRTGAKLVVDAPYVQQLPAALVDRIKQAVASGQGIADFTPDELKTFKAAHDFQMDNYSKLPRVKRSRLWGS